MASKVIKDNDGVAIVEGTPEASLIKDSQKFFNAPLPKRKAGDKIVEASLSQEPVLVLETLREGSKFAEPAMKATPKLVPVLETLREGSKFAEPAMSDERDRQSREAPPEYMTQESEQEKTPQETKPKRKEAVNKSREFKRARFIERSAGEQAATQGSFISTLYN